MNIDTNPNPLSLLATLTALMEVQVALLTRMNENLETIIGGRKSAAAAEQPTQAPTEPVKRGPGRPPKNPAAAKVNGAADPAAVASAAIEAAAVAAGLPPAQAQAPAQPAAVPPAGVPAMSYDDFKEVFNQFIADHKQDGSHRAMALLERYAQMLAPRGITVKAFRNIPEALYRQFLTELGALLPAQA